MQLGIARPVRCSGRSARRRRRIPSRDAGSVLNARRVLSMMSCGKLNTVVVPGVRPHRADLELLLQLVPGHPEQLHAAHVELLALQAAGARELPVAEDRVHHRVHARAETAVAADRDLPGPLRLERVRHLRCCRGRCDRCAATAATTPAAARRCSSPRSGSPVRSGGAGRAAASRTSCPASERVMLALADRRIHDEEVRRRARR